MIKKLLLSLSITVIWFLLLSCAVNPVTGKKEFMLLSEAEELDMGKEYDPEVVAMYGLYEDPALQAFITERGVQMAKVSHRPHLNYEFKILDTPIINAFAVPGGYVYFTRGILAYFNNEAEFAGVLGHEIGHITARHSARQYSKSMVAAVGVGLAGEISEELGTVASIAEVGLGLLFLKYSRDDESESDTLGVEYSTKIGYDAQEMARFFATLEQMGGGDQLTFLSTHPNPKDRKEKVRQLALQWRQQVGLSEFKVNRGDYLELIDNLVFGNDPRHGYVEENRFYHPTHRFQFPIPQGWKVADSSKTRVQIVSDDEEAAFLLTISVGKPLEEVTQKFTAQEELTILSSKDTTVNGFPARVIEAETGNEEAEEAEEAEDADEDQVKLLSYFIAYNSNVYTFHGVANSNEFETYRNTFRATMENFSRLDAPDKINVKPERIRIKTVARTGTLDETLRAFNVPKDRAEQHALLNGIALTDTVHQGAQIKIIKKD